MNLEEEQYGNHSGSCPVQMQPDYLDGQGQDNSRSMLNSQHQGPDMDNCDWPIHEQDQHQDTIEDNVSERSHIKRRKSQSKSS
ncbi:uncharacterized protein LOC111045239 isoform X3 [Nilaparvata lugens]|uniref:uncharacterized protein LOC111045239 isoform X3 n=1 Tax=Nilaparvata lugens TaxID=108931 RepID=UPI00193E7EC5|nr:uncharacterized protein LOC111045239 isoform X3 [Nilaparvata lugens]